MCQRVRLPFQVIETINESRATREVQKMTSLGLFDVYEGREGDTFEAGWRNKLIWGDNLLVMGSLLEKFAGKIDLIYIDPPFATGADFSFISQIGEHGAEVVKDASAIEEKAYRDTWGRGLESYLSMLCDRFRCMKELLSSTGLLYVHVGPNVSHYVKLTLDFVFGTDRFINEIVWQRTGGAHSDADRYGNIHDVVFVYASGVEWTYNPVYIPYSEDYINERFKSVEPKTERRYWLNTMTAKGSGPARLFQGKLRNSPTGTHWRFSQENIDKHIKDGRIVFSKSGMPYVKQYLDESPWSALSDRSGLTWCRRNLEARELATKPKSHPPCLKGLSARLRTREISSPIFSVALEQTLAAAEEARSPLDRLRSWTLGDPRHRANACLEPRITRRPFGRC